MTRKVISSDLAPKPAGKYSQGILASGPFLFISGQTPRKINGERLVNASIEEQTRLTLDNLNEIAKSAGLSINDSVKVTVYLKDLNTKAEFEKVYSEYITGLAPARIVIQSSFIDFDVEIDAILQA
jgi:2-iminobutanoate/2-iminopropanoate deaminase